VLLKHTICTICALEIQYLHNLHYWNTLCAPFALLRYTICTICTIDIFCCTVCTIEIHYLQYLHYWNTFVALFALLKYRICTIYTIERTIYTIYMIDLHYWHFLATLFALTPFALLALSSPAYFQNGNLKKTTPSSKHIAFLEEKGVRALFRNSRWWIFANRQSTWKYVFCYQTNWIWLVNKHQSNPIVHQKHKIIPPVHRNIFISTIVNNGGVRAGSSNIGR